MTNVKRVDAVQMLQPTPVQSETPLFIYSFIFLFWLVTIGNGDEGKETST